MIARSLARDPSRRPQTAEELLDELDAIELSSALDLAGTAVFPPPVSQTQVQPRAALVPSSGRRWGALAFVLAAVAFVALVLTLGSVLGSDDEGASTDASAVDSTVGPTTIPPTEPTPAPTEPTAPPTVPVETTIPVEEVIPGFPVTDEITVFLAQLHQNPELVGPAGPELAAKLDAVLAERSRRKRNDAAEDLRSWVGEQAAGETLAPEIAALADDLLADLTHNGPGRGNKNDNKD